MKRFFGGARDPSQRERFQLFRHHLPRVVLPHARALQPGRRVTFTDAR